MIINTSIYIQ